MAEKERKIKTVSNIEHILLRPSMYIGGIANQDYEAWIFNKKDELEYSTVTYPEGLLKIINEAIDNSVDEHIKTNGKYATKINVKITKDTFSVTEAFLSRPSYTAETSDDSRFCFTLLNLLSIIF